MDWSTYLNNFERLSSQSVAAVVGYVSHEYVLLVNWTRWNVGVRVNELKRMLEHVGCQSVAAVVRHVSHKDIHLGSGTWQSGNRTRQGSHTDKKVRYMQESERTQLFFLSFHVVSWWPNKWSYRARVPLDIRSFIRYWYSKPLVGQNCKHKTDQYCCVNYKYR